MKRITLALLAIITSNATIAETEVAQEPETIEAAALPLYILDSHHFILEHDRIYREVARLQPQPEPITTSSVQIRKRHSANQFSTRANFAWRSRNEQLSIKLIGTFDSRLAQSGWVSNWTPELGVTLKPSETWSFSLNLRDSQIAKRGDHNVKGSFAFNF